jgi:hypothetical protein
VVPRQKPAAAWPYAADTARHTPSGFHASLRAFLLPPRADSPQLPPPFPSPRLTAASQQQQPQSRLRHRTRHRRRRRSGRSVSPSTPPSCPELRLSLAQPVLTSAARGKPPLLVNCSSEFRSSSPELFAPWTAPFRPTFFPSSTRILFTMAYRYSSTLPVPKAWSGMAGR